MNRDRPTGGRAGAERRRFLAALGTVATGTIAGCNVGVSGGDSTGEGPDTDDPAADSGSSPDSGDDGPAGPVTDRDGEWTATVEEEYPGWTQFRYDTRNTGHNRAASGPTGEVEVKWKVNVGTDVRTPVVADGAVYVLARESGTVHALDADTGETLWTHEDGKYLDYYPGEPRDTMNTWEQKTTPAVSGEYVFVSSDHSSGGALLGLDRASGEIAWEYSGAGLDEEPASPVVADGRVYLVGESYLRAFEPDEEFPEWTTEISDVDTPPAIEGGALYLNGEGLRVLDAETGEEYWRTASYGHTSPVVVNGRVFTYSCTPAPEVVVHEATPEGEVVWEWPGEAPSHAYWDTTWAPVVAHGNAYVQATPWHPSETYDEEPTTYALDVETGEVVWESRRWPGARPAAADDALYCYDYAGAEPGVVAVDPADGTDLWRFGIEAEIPPRSSVVVDDDVVYLAVNERASDGGDYIYALEGSA